MTQVVEILAHVRRGLNLFCVINIRAADDLAMQGGSASATMIFTLLNQINLVLACLGLTIYQSIRMFVQLLGFCFRKKKSSAVFKAGACFTEIIYRCFEPLATVCATIERSPQQ